MSKTSKSMLPRMWLGWLLVVAVSGLAVFAMRGRAPKVEGQDPAPARESVSEQPVVPSRHDAGSAGVRLSSQPSAMDNIRAAAERRGAQAAAGTAYWEGGFAAQRTDPAWAPQAKRSILALLESEEFMAGPSPRDLSVDCRTSVCVLTATFDSVSSGEDWIELVTLHSGGQFTGGASQLQRDSSGSAKIRIFVQPSR